VNRLEETWRLFRELEPKLIVNDEQIFREPGTASARRTGSAPTSTVAWARRRSASCSGPRPRRRGRDAARDIRTSKGQKQQREIKRLKVVSAFTTSENRPEWMILEAVPAIPLERPMVQLDGGCFATSTSTTLPQVINRNNRLETPGLGAAEIIVNNEKRMLQELSTPSSTTGAAAAP
jgi:DNA-directed RNA polymerase subunit beta'